MASCLDEHDIFSFGVVSEAVFTLMQTFLKPAIYQDPATRRVLGRTEIKCSEEYIVPMKAALACHPLVQLTIDCLEYIV